MGCVKLHILDEQYKSTELRVSYFNKELTLNNSAENPRRWTLVNRVDPTGMDWYIDKDGIYQYNPDLTNDNQADILQEGQAYVGVTHQVKDANGNVIENYRKDGSIMYSNETSAYNRMWSEANKKNAEESGYALENGKFLVLPSYNNKNDDASPEQYGYSVNKEGKLTRKEDDEVKETFKITGNVHTHQDKTGSPAPSWITKNGWGDVGHSKTMGGLPIITMGWDGEVYGKFWSNKHGGHEVITGLPTNAAILSGKIKLVPWLKGYPVKGK